MEGSNLTNANLFGALFLEQRRQAVQRQPVIVITDVENAVSVVSEEEQYRIDEEVFQQNDLLAKQGNAEAQVKCGEMLCCGCGVTQSYERAISYFQAAVDQNNRKACILLGDLYRDIKRYTEAFTCYQIAKELGYSSAFSRLANMYALGHYVSKDLDMAKEYNQIAIEQEDPGGYINLGSACFFQLSDEFDVADAEKYFLKAAELGNSEAFCWLGLVYKSKQNYSGAIDFFQQAITKGDKSAITHLGHLYFEGADMQADNIKAFKCYEKAAKEGCIAGMYYLGCAYEYGWGVQKDAAKAVMWVQKAVELKNHEACLKLGLWYEKGKYVGKPDVVKAVFWYKTAYDLNGGVMDAVWTDRVKMLLNSKKHKERLLQ